MEKKKGIVKYYIYIFSLFFASISGGEESGQTAFFDRERENTLTL